MYMNDSSSLKSALMARKKKDAQPMSGPDGDMKKDMEDEKPGDGASDLAPLPEHSEQMGENPDDPNQQMDAGSDPVISIDKSPDKTTVSIDIPLMASKTGEPDMDDMHDEMTSGMSDSDQQSLMSREPKSLMERARKAALMSKSNKM